MYDQLPMHISLMELERELRAWQKEAETLHALGDRPAPLTGLRRWIAAAGGQIARVIWPRKPPPALAGGGRGRTELGSSAAA
jgi:hypothetical protein